MSAAPRECEVVAFFLVHEHRQDLPIHPQSASTSTCGWRIRKPSRNRSMLFSLKPESSSTPSRWRAEMCC